MENERVIIGQREWIGGQFVELWVLKTQRWLYVAPHSLLTENVGDVIGAERAGGMSPGDRGCDGIGAIFTNQEEQFADLPGQ